LLFAAGHVEPPSERPQPTEEAAQPEGGSPAAAAPSEPAAEGGNEMSGIDPTFLDALPPELRAEVLENQQAAARRYTSILVLVQCVDLMHVALSVAGSWQQECVRIL
jgi:hypothetical protein